MIFTVFPFGSLVSPTAQLLWEEGEEKEGPEEEGEVKVKVKVKVVQEEEEGEVEELDYDESMEDLDLHPTGNIDEVEGDEESRAHRLSVASDSRPGKILGKWNQYISVADWPN